MNLTTAGAVAALAGPGAAWPVVGRAANVPGMPLGPFGQPPQPHYSGTLRMAAGESATATGRSITGRPARRASPISGAAAKVAGTAASTKMSARYRKGWSSGGKRYIRH